MLYRRFIQFWQHYPNKMLLTITIGNNIVNIAASVLASLYVRRLLFHHVAAAPQWAAEVVSVSAMSFLVIIFGEIVPKTIAKHYPVQTSAVTVPVLSVCYYLFYLFAHILNPVAGVILLLFRINVWRKSAEVKIDRAEIEAAIDFGLEDGILAEEERKIAKKIIRMREIKIKNIMTHRLKIVSVGLDASYDEMVSLARSSGRSKLPVYDGDKNNIVGVVFIKDLSINAKRKKAARQYMREPVFVPELINIPSLLKIFREEETHIVLVVDEYGSLAGLVSLEDITYEMFGEVEDRAS